MKANTKAIVQTCEHRMLLQRIEHRLFQKISITGRFLSSTAIAPKAAGVRVMISALAGIKRNLADRHSADWRILCSDRWKLQRNPSKEEAERRGYTRGQLVEYVIVLMMAMRTRGRGGQS